MKTEPLPAVPVTVTRVITTHRRIELSAEQVAAILMNYCGVKGGTIDFCIAQGDGFLKGVIIDHGHQRNLSPEEAPGLGEEHF